ncbi:MAG: hypothetical protein FWG42_09695 [Clostridiales bacterium]|nr:hypothetical protein [Clostridiales bacterium]
MWRMAAARVLCVSAILFAAGTSHAVAETASFLISGEHEYKAVRLTPPIYGGANRDLSDLLVLDEEGKPVPYFINSYEISQSKSQYFQYPLMHADTFVKSGDTYDDYYIETSENRDMLATSVSIETNSGMFAKSVELRGSYDGVVWDFVKNDKLYRVDESEKLSIAFEKPLKYTHYRFRVHSNAEKGAARDALSISGVFLEYSQDTMDKVYFTETMEPAFKIEQRGGSTVIKLQGLNNVRINEVTIHTGDQFKRMAYFAQGNAKVLYNLSFSGNDYQDLTLGFNGFSESAAALEIEISNGDDAPIAVSGATLTYFADDVVFKGENGKAYSLSFGDADVSRAPVYDIAGYKDLVLEEGYDTLAILGIKQEEMNEVVKPDYSAAFNAVVIAVSILLGFVILMRVRRREAE